jgi:hypothetical protein
LSTQKIIPVIRIGWAALVGWTGVAKTPKGEDIGDWVTRSIETIPMDGRFQELQKVLLSANHWLAKSIYRDLAFSVVGFVRRKPVAMVISNFLGIAGQIWSPRKPNLEESSIRPKAVEVLIAGDSTGVSDEMKRRLKAMLNENRDPSEMHAAMAAINAEASVISRQRTISKECVTGCMLPTGHGTAICHGIPNDIEYIPGFIRRSFLSMNVIGFRLKKTEEGKTVPPGWVQMTWRTQPDKRKGIVIVAAHEIRGIDGVVTKDHSGGNDDYWKL